MMTLDRSKGRLWLVGWSRRRSTTRQGTASAPIAAVPNVALETRSLGAGRRHVLTAAGRQPDQRSTSRRPACAGAAGHDAAGYRPSCDCSRSPQTG